MDLTAVYCSEDDFWKSFKQEQDKYLIYNGKQTKRESDSTLLFFLHRLNKQVEFYRFLYLLQL
jgi:hypothetical protein